MIIAISGSPATGKTTLAKELAKRLGYEYVDVNLIVKDNNLSEGYDEKRKCEIVDTKKLNTKLVELFKDDAIIDSHLSHNLPNSYVTLCIITKCDIKVLSKRLQQRGYDEAKVRENLDAEIFDVGLEEARELDHNIMVIDTTEGYDIEEIISKIR